MAHVKALQRLGTLLTTLLVSLLALPLVSAYTARTGISPLNKIVETMAWMFDLPVLKNHYVQVGFIRFMLFILFLALAHWSFKKVFGEDKKGANKTAGILATVFALIASFLMPEAWVTANGGVITAIFTALIPLGVVGVGIWFCMSKEKGLNKSFATRLVAIVILFMLLMILDVYRTALDLPGVPLLLLIPVSLFRRKRGDR